MAVIKILCSHVNMLRYINKDGAVMSAVIHAEISLFEQYSQVRQQSESIAAPLKPEDTVPQSMPDASPIKWHLAHTTWFYETFILRAQANYTEFHPDFQYLFNSYYNGVGEQYTRANRGLVTRPDLQQVMQYRQHVDMAMQKLLESSQDEGIQTLLVLGMNHEQQHQELMLTDLKHLLSHNPLHPSYVAEKPYATNRMLVEKRWLPIEGGLLDIGNNGDTEFIFDNEGPLHKHYLSDFEIASHCVSNAEYLEFIRAGGYQNPTYWLSDGWAFISENHITAPMYWQMNETGEWCYYTLNGLQKLDLQAPVTHISYYEADAFATFKAARLPTEQEWEVACRQMHMQSKVIGTNFAESGQYKPVDTNSPNNFLGNVWQWTQSSYSAYPGFKAWEGTVGEYNGKFMSGQMVLRGGSCATSASHIRSSYRNFFPPSARWQFSGIRLVK